MDIFDNMARVLVIIGSPRKIGNSFKIVKLIEERIKTRGGVELATHFSEMLILSSVEDAGCAFRLEMNAVL